MVDKKKVLSWADIEEFDDSVRAEVNVFGGTIVLVSLGAELMAEYIGERGEKTSEGIRNVLLLVYSMFTEEERALAPEVRKPMAYDRARKWKRKSASTLGSLTKKALEINGLSVEAEAERKNG